MKDEFIFVKHWPSHWFHFKWLTMDRNFFFFFFQMEDMCRKQIFDDYQFYMDLEKLGIYSTKDNPLRQLGRYWWIQYRWTTWSVLAYFAIDLFFFFFNYKRIWWKCKYYTLPIVIQWKFNKKLFFTFNDEVPRTWQVDLCNTFFDYILWISRARFINSLFLK